jgi:hypothetical protein
VNEGQSIGAHEYTGKVQSIAQSFGWPISEVRT